MRDPKVEKYLETFGLHFDYEPALPVRQIDVVASAQHNARETPVMPDIIERYALAMQAEANFPALVVVRLEGEKFFLLSGVQRTYAARKIKRETFDAYIVEPIDPTLSQLICRSINCLEGQGHNSKVAMENAILMVTTYKCAQKQVASVFGLSPAAISHEINARVTKARLGAMGVSPATLRRDVVKKLHTFDSDPVLAATGGLIARAQLPAAESDELIEQVRQQRSEQKQLQVVEEWKARKEVKARIAHGREGQDPLPKTMGLPSQLRSSINRLHGLLHSATHVAETPLTEEEIEEITGLWEDLTHTGRRFFARRGEQSRLTSTFVTAVEGREPALTR